MNSGSETMGRAFVGAVAGFGIGGLTMWASMHFGHPSAVAWAGPLFGAMAIIGAVVGAIWPGSPKAKDDD